MLAYNKGLVQELTNEFGLKLNQKSGCSKKQIARFKKNRCSMQYLKSLAIAPKPLDG